MLSRPTWGVWIEIMDIKKLAELLGSRPTRGVWIEIVAALFQNAERFVTPHTGRVD